MYYIGFAVKNYKGIKNLELDLIKDPCNKVFTLVGLNESGKTTILEAISLLNIQDTPNNVHDYIPKSLRIDFTGKIDITAELEFDQSDIDYLTNKLKDLNCKNITIAKNVNIFKVYNFVASEYVEGYDERLSLTNIKLSKGKSKTIKSIREFPDLDDVIDDIVLKELLPPILYYPNFLFDFPEKIFLEPMFGETEEQPLYREVLGDILSSIDINLNIHTHVLSRLKSPKADSKRSLESTLLKMSSKVTKIVFRAWDAIFESTGKEIVIDSDIDELGRYYLRFNLKEHSNYFQISERSLGFRWFFTFLLFTEFRKNRVHNKGEMLFMLDEPASNLHSTAQKKLLATFEDILQNAKLIYTTHSHHLINPKWLSGAYIVRNKTVNLDEAIDYDIETTDIEAILYKKFVAIHPNQKTYFQPILDTLDYQPGLIEEVPNIIITEGKNDYYALKYFIKLFNKAAFKNIHLYPGGGANRNSQTISLYLGWGRPFLILLDSDAGGESAKRKYNAEFGPIVNEIIKTYTDIDDRLTNRAVEDLFSEEDKMKLSQRFDNKLLSFKKSAFNTSIENLFISNETYIFSRETLTNFDKILTYLSTIFIAK